MLTGVAALGAAAASGLGSSAGWLAQAARSNVPVRAAATPVMRLFMVFPPQMLRQPLPHPPLSSMDKPATFLALIHKRTCSQKDLAVGFDSGAISYLIATALPPCSARPRPAAAVRLLPRHRSRSDAPRTCPGE